MRPRLKPDPEVARNVTALRRPPPPDAQERIRQRRESGVPVAAPAPVARVTSVDALRGFAIFWILGGDGLAWSLREMSASAPWPLNVVGTFFGTQLSHVAWEGFRFYDLVFPLFVFTTGVAVVLSLTKVKAHGGNAHGGKAQAHWRVLRRFVLLFMLGIVYYGGVSEPWPDIRLLGVLQRLALCYLFASLLFLHLDLRGLAVAFVSLLVGYWALMTFVPVPGLGAAGSYAPNLNLADWIDLHYLPGKLWDHVHDPEGMLSTLPAIGTSLMGVFAGMLLLNPRMEAARKSLWLVGAGIASVAAGYLWGLQFPVIKNLWTSSFVLVAGGYSLLLLGVMYQTIDVWGMKSWAMVFVWIGANAITLYLFNNVASFERIAVRFVGGDVSTFLDQAVAPGTGRFVAHALGLAIAVALARFLYRRRIFLRV
jgi:predicted acyltransferase